jgi:hypothetical protein
MPQNLYPDGKNHAVLSSHRDSFPAKVPGLCPDASSSNAYEIIPPGRYVPYYHTTNNLQYEKTTLSITSFNADQLQPKE